MTSLVNGYNHIKCVSLSNQKCQIQPTLINLHFTTIHLLHYYNIHDLSNKVCIPNKTEDLNLRVFNMITEISESRTLTKHISCECKCKIDGTKCNSNQWWNNNKCRCECKKRHICEKDYVWNPTTCNCGNGKYLASTINDSAIICDEVIDADAKLNPEGSNDETKTIPIIFNEKKVTCKTQNFYISLAILLIRIRLLILISIYCYLIKY